MLFAALTKFTAGFYAAWAFFFSFKRANAKKKWIKSIEQRERDRESARKWGNVGKKEASWQTLNSTSWPDFDSGLHNLFLDRFIQATRSLAPMKFYLRCSISEWFSECQTPAHWNFAQTNYLDHNYFPFDDFPSLGHFASIRIFFLSSFAFISDGKKSCTAVCSKMDNRARNMCGIQVFFFFLCSVHLGFFH